MFDNILKSSKLQWTTQNIEFFGVEPRNWNLLDLEENNRHLAQYAESYWNSGDCELKKLILEDKVSRNSKILKSNSFKLSMNPISGCIDLYGEYNKEKLIMSFPTPRDNLTWTISNTSYTPRVTAFRNFPIIRNGNIIKSYGWSYDIDTKEFEGEFKFETLSERNIALCEAALENKYKENIKLTEENLKEAFEILPEFHMNSVYMFDYQHLDLFFNNVKSGKRFANPITNHPFSVGMMFLSQNAGGRYEANNKLVLVESDLFALENYKTVIYYTKNNYKFLFEDTSLFFDPFKTSTNKSAGKQRLLLDNIYVKNNMLWLDDKNMFQLYYNPELQKNGISGLGWAPFCRNNDAKRQMITTKTNAQAIHVKGEYDKVKHRILGRVVFADLKGYSEADSIIISESFAEKLGSVQHKKIDILKKDIKNIDYYIQKAENFEELTIEDLYELFPRNNKIVLESYRDVSIVQYEILDSKMLKINIQYTIPFGLGDKITNLHGTKGVCGLILPDEEMPRLKNDIGGFHAGPFDIVISGMSVMRRVAIGQIFEAWANASGLKFELDDFFILNAIKKYKKEMKEFSKKSIIEYEGVESIKPCGIINLVRLHHHASTKTSVSFLKTDNTTMLKLAEMEKLNLAANDCMPILTELDIRSTKKHASAFKMIYDMQKYGILPTDAEPSLNFNKLIRSMGVDMKMNGKSLVSTDYKETNSVFEKLYNMSIDSQKISLKELFEEVSRDLGKEENNGAHKS